MERQITKMCEEEERMLKHYGEILKKRRKERGITMVELFERTGVPCRAIADVEKGLIDLTEEQKWRISKFLRRQKIL